MRAAIRVAGFIGLMLSSSQLLADYQLNMRTGVTAVSQAAHGIHTLVMWISVGIAVVVFGAMTYAIINHRKSKGHKAANFDDNLKLEVVWTIIPFIILGFMAVPATKVLLEMEDVSNSDMSIKVTAYQWKWHYEYLGEGVSFFSNITTPDSRSPKTSANVDVTDKNYLLDVDNRVVVPVNKKIRMLFTSNDVIHAWWMPDFAIKKDAIPGFINESWFKTDKPGVYRGQCAELCGTNHGFMPIVVEVKSQEDYIAWLGVQKAAAAEAVSSSEKTWSMDELMSHGEKVYATNCAACHQSSGEGIPNVFPALKGSAIATGDVSKHIKTVLKGVSGTAMQAFGGQLNDADLAALITYERNAWGNSTGDIVQPSDIKAGR